MHSWLCLACYWFEMPVMPPIRRALAIVKLSLVVVFVVLFAVPGVFAAQQDGTQATPAPKSRVRAVGTIKSITGNTITLTTDTGPEVSVVIQPSTRLVRSVPGQTDLKSASPIEVQDLQVGDRLLVGGTVAEDGKAVLATTAIVMKKSDIAEKQAAGSRGVAEARRRRCGESGRCRHAKPSRFPPARLAAEKLTIHVSKTTIIRRYAPDSVKFDDAKPGTLDQIKQRRPTSRARYPQR